ncbi:RcnB family protein [Novosphingobium piscinae]|uniref:RcnB family protein n=1 Tax=Novosphingobium piscinae TaxID=1507448 RepID=A0A7X1FYC9_9SPHN|nr:RcnB family protein [Novosphingobium piscinae]MBC2668632.1 RcnB family protein [Novosphingobium piscinae]
MAAGFGRSSHGLAILLAGVAALGAGPAATAQDRMERGPELRAESGRGWDRGGAPDRSQGNPAAPRGMDAEGARQQRGWNGPRMGSVATPPPRNPGYVDPGRDPSYGADARRVDAARQQGWDGQRWNGQNWDGRNWDGRDRDRQRDDDRRGNRQGWNGQGWNGQGWNGQGWNGQGWNGQDRDGRRGDGPRWNGRDDQPRSDRNRNWNGTPNRGWDNDRGWSNRPDWSTRREGWSSRGERGWDRQWRQDRRYDWRSWRNGHREIYRVGRYTPPFRNYAYRRLGIGIIIDNGFFGSRYWINDPWMYRLPPAFGPYRWIRYYDDALMVNIYDGQVVDVIYDFFW